MIKIDANFKEVGSYIDLIPNNIKRAAHKTINDTLFDIRSEYIKEMPNIFESPNMTYLRKAFQIDKATPDNLTGSLYVKDDNISKGGTRFIDVLYHHVHGSDRSAKRFEKTLSYDVSIMGKSMIAAPTQFSKFDQYGGLDGKFNSMLLSYFGIYNKAGFKANMGLKKKAKIADRGTHWASKVRTGKTLLSINGKEYFMIGVGHNRRRNSPLKPGIYERTGLHGMHVKPVILFLKKGAYKKRFDFYGIAHSVINKQFQSKFYKNIQTTITNDTRFLHAL